MFGLYYGVFKANAIFQLIHGHRPQLRSCRRYAHHQNGITELSIQTVSNLAKSMLLHASVHWKYGAQADLWSMSVRHVTYIYNHSPKNGFCPANIFWWYDSSTSSQRFGDSQSSLLTQSFSACIFYRDANWYGIWRKLYFRSKNICSKAHWPWFIEAVKVSLQNNI